MRFPALDVSWAQKLRESYEQLLSLHLAAIPKTSPDRLVFAWHAVANDYRQLALVLYGSGGPVENVRQLLLDAARAHLEMVRLRGSGEFPSKLSLRDYSIGNSRATYLAICMALLAHELDLARALAPLVWDPPAANYIGPTSVVCTDLQQIAAYALKHLMMDNRESADALLSSKDRIPEDIIGEFLMLRGLASADTRHIAKGLALELVAHAQMANEAKNLRVPDYFLAIPALGLASYAIHRGMLKLTDLPSDNVYFPRDMIVF